MKVFGQFKCMHCGGEWYDLHRKTVTCRCCNNTGWGRYRQEYREGDLLLETCLCSKKGPLRKSSKWCVEVCTLQRSRRSDLFSHITKGNVSYVWCHDYEYDAWSGSLKYAYKKALKNAPEALKNKTKNNMWAMIMDLLEE